MPACRKDCIVSVNILKSKPSLEHVKCHQNQSQVNIFLLFTGRYTFNCTECQIKTQGMDISWLKFHIVHKTRTKKTNIIKYQRKAGRSFQAASNIL